MTILIQMFTVSNTWKCIIRSIQESSMILECNLAVFGGKISGNNLRIFVKFRIEGGFADTMSEMDRGDHQQVKVLRGILTGFADHLIKTFGYQAGRCAIVTFAVIRSEHDDHEINRIMYLDSSTNHVQSATVFTKFILKDGCSSTKTFFNNMTVRAEFFLQKASPSYILIKAAFPVRSVSPGI